MKGLLADLKHAARVYARTPLASGLAVVVLAVAMAFVSSFLSLYIDIVYKPHPGFEDSGRLVTIGQNDGRVLSSTSLNLLNRINDEVVSLSAVAGFLTLNEQIGPDHEQHPIELVTDRFFSDIRPRIELGRGLDERDHAVDAEPVAVISYRYWQQEYGGMPDAIGRILEITGRPQFNPTPPGAEPEEPPEDQTTEFRIIGVMSEDLPGLQAQETVAWIAFEAGAPLYFGPWANVQGFQSLRGLGRLADGANPAAVAAELTERYGDAQDLNVQPDRPFDAMPGIVFNINAQREAKRQLQLFLGGSILLAFVAAANVSLFLLSRAPGRRRELGIRMAVGARLRRLGRQLATEAAMLVALATLAGFLVAFWLQKYLQGAAFLARARWLDVSLFDWRVLGVILVFLLALTLIVSLAPVFGLKRLGIASSSRKVATRANLTQRTACTAQVAIAGTVAAAAVAFGWYLGLLVTKDYGYDARNVDLVTLKREPQVFSNRTDAAFERRFVERERTRELIAALPGIDSVAFGSAAPGFGNLTLIARIPRPVPPEGTVQFGAVSADRQLFEMLGIALVDGHIYEGDETDVMMVNEAAAELIWGHIDAAGETLPIALSDADSSEIVGVVADVPYGHPEADIDPRVYLPLFPFAGVDSIFVKSALSPAEVRTQLQSLIDKGELDITIDDVTRLTDRVSDLLAADRARSYLTIGTAVVVLLLAGLGFYGTQRYLVSAGRREYAIRASVGAGPKALGRIVLLRGLVLSLPGVVLGGLFAFIVAAWLRDDFVSREISPGVVTVAVIAGLIALLLAASLAPARQARRTQPAPLLREE
jgi:putative ABC transport system permease protein